ncbi:MAG: hypothetical protein ACYCS7_16825 [Acidimicrobiales bacterium]
MSDGNVSATHRAWLGMRLARQASQHTSDRTVHQALAFLEEQILQGTRTGLQGLLSNVADPVTDEVWAIIGEVVDCLEDDSEVALGWVLVGTIRAYALDALRRNSVRHDWLAPWSEPDDLVSRLARIPSTHIDSDGRRRSDDVLIDRVLPLREECALICGFAEDHVDFLAHGVDERMASNLYEAETRIRTEFLALAKALKSLEELQSDIASALDPGTLITWLRVAAVRDGLATSDQDTVDTFLVDCLQLKSRDQAERSFQREALWLVLNRSRTWLSVSPNKMKAFLAKSVTRQAKWIRVRTWGEDNSFWTYRGKGTRPPEPIYLTAIEDLDQLLPDRSDDVATFIADLDERRRSGDLALAILGQILSKGSPAERTLITALAEGLTPSEALRTLGLRWSDYQGLQRKARRHYTQQLNKDLPF